MNPSSPPDVYLDITSKEWKNAIGSPSNTIEIWSLTLYDLIELKNPDGLSNGASMINVIRRRAPAIVNPHGLTESQYHQIVNSLWLATYGNRMELTTRCDQCKESIEFEYDLGKSINHIQNLSSEKSAMIGEHEIEFSPSTFNDMIAASSSAYAFNKSLYTVRENPTINFDVRRFSEYLHSSTDSDRNIKSKRILSIDNELVSPDVAAQWIDQLDQKQYAQLDTLMTAGDYFSQEKIKCPECSYINTVTTRMDPIGQFYSQLISTPDEELPDFFSRLDRQKQEINDQAMKLCWYMRGGVSVTEIMHMNASQRQAIEKTVNDNIELSKRAKTPIL